MKDILAILKGRSVSEKFNLIKIGLASPELILSRSYGEVKKPETINYRTFKAEKDGLFCARIFGPTKDYECLCGKYKRLKHRGVICEKCGVEVTLTKVRRTRMGNINLATPVTHIWFLRSLPSKISLLLNMSLTDVERILYFERYIVIDPGTSLLERYQIITEKEYLSSSKEFGDEFIAKIGGEAILHLLKDLNLSFESDILITEIKHSKSDIKIKQMLKRLKLIESFIKSGNKPEWMIITSLPVLPPDLRPLVPLDGGRFASSDLNDLYRRIINRNNRLKRLIDLDAPSVIIKNEKRMLQESVDALIDNGKKGKVVNGANKRPLKSLADIIKGKQGRFRQNLLGKRVDYSGRSVIVVGPQLKLNQCGIPKIMALELFKPFIFCELKKRNVTATIKKCKKIVEKAGPEVWDILSEVIIQYPVLLNRAPTLHRLGIQAFDPILIDEKVIKLHPLVCTAFNADFDGDQMAVHIPLTIESQLEARVLMMSTTNVLSPANGDPIIVPTQDMVLGIYYLSKVKKNAINKNNYFKYIYQIEHAYENNFICLHTPIFFKNNDKFVETTFGRLIIKSIIHEKLDFDLINRIMTKKEISNLMKQCFRKLGIKETVELADRLKDLGFEYATKSGMSIGIDDLTIPEEKYKIVKNSKASVEKLEDQYSTGLVTKEEKYSRVIDIWSKANDSVTVELMKNLSMSTIEDGNIIEEFFNPVYMMAESGARGSIAQIRQLAGMRGLMVKTDGSIIETPITANFKEGLNILQYFISTHGARKGLADTALKTANSGYLTRRLVDAAQDVVVIINDCKTEEYIIMKPVVDGGNIIEDLKDRVYGRTIHESIFDLDGKEIIKKGELLSETNIHVIEKLNIEKLKIRSVIKCESQRGVCAKCYGSDLTTGKLVDLGEAVGVIAAQSIGEPGTQLTMRTFHIGGTASKDILKNYIQSKTEGIVKFENSSFITNERSKSLICISRSTRLLILDENNKEKEQYRLPYGAVVNITEGSFVKDGDMIAQWDPHHYPIISELKGYIKYVNLIENRTVKKEVDEITGLTSLVVTELDAIGESFTAIKPIIKIIQGEKSSSYYLLPGTVVHVEDEQYVNMGEIIARTPREAVKTKDIIGGLPKVADIFEARKPKDPAVLAEISGKIKFGKDTKGKKRIIIESEPNKEYEILIPKWKSPSVFENEFVKKGEIIVEGQYNPHDILNLLGIDELTEYIKREVQDIYRMQGVKIDDRHIEVIIKQMTRKAVILNPGDGKFLIDDKESINLLKKINLELKKDNKKIVSYKQILLGITKASLTTDSFISAASFQETTKVLTEAAISGRKDMLLGLKENVVVGKLIPAGTGFCKRLE